MLKNPQTTRNRLRKKFELGSDSFQLNAHLHGRLHCGGGFPQEILCILPSFLADAKSGNRINSAFVLPRTARVSHYFAC
jgi:hypothetical protein